MTYPKPGEIVLTDPTTGDVVTETYDHVDMTEYGARVERHEQVDGIRKTLFRDKYPSHRVVAVHHEFRNNDDGSREYVSPADDDWGESDR